ncbi:Crp/Fnr family transcriptional regulator [Deinococcus metallilatus]|uniref:CRP-like cAMP-binding protein n=2 Tax=Deinococcus TaxID=1298 RepID=A0AAJ5F4P3_9DEIO|nr:Crp/Fnr family transcriptional regulator [Deinococcus metallilatus]MBB5294293.1 CRP-like cAMP-binding protein [Deinococcus metallilatus]QBY09065.1 Crp/Fnr family transcriptional regulator [Deinococcus metallilatus]RXJ10209.1 Crp/Fnr family transcriptional regulator [Deinococcus metallilatus]TLK27854.1 Crp/Fnr family transcriptional regulator [Deinococcus metallilatus]GMA16370.1 cyclic AMP receptor protein [Deinococcus metallilatus]
MACLDDLNRSPLFQNVPEDAMREALRVVTERTFQPGELVVEQDAQGEALHLITAGVVRVSRVSLGSRERVLGDIYAPGVVGETAVLARQERSASVRALTAVRTLMLHRDHFELILRRHPRVLWNLAEMLARRVTFLNDELIAFGQNTEAALAHVFSNLYRQRVAADAPQPEVLPLGTHDIMARTSSSRETVSRVLKKLEAQDILKVSPQTVTLLDLAALEAVLVEGNEAD